MKILLNKKHLITNALKVGKELYKALITGAVIGVSLCLIFVIFDTFGLMLALIATIILLTIALTK